MYALKSRRPIYDVRLSHYMLSPLSGGTAAEITTVLVLLRVETRGQPYVGRELGELKLAADKNICSFGSFTSNNYCSAVGVTSMNRTTHVRCSRDATARLDVNA